MGNTENDTPSNIALNATTEDIYLNATYEKKTDLYYNGFLGTRNNLTVMLKSTLSDIFYYTNMFFYV